MAPAILAVFAVGCRYCLDPASVQLPGSFDYSPDAGVYVIEGQVTMTPSTGELELTYALDSGYPLPAGLSLHPETGLISGMPTALSPRKDYSVVATSPNGSSSVANLSIQVIVGEDAGVSHLAAGGHHTCAVVNGGALCWGRNNYGQLGNDSTAPEIPVPVRVAGLSAGVEALSAGDNHTCAVAGGGVRCWGYNGGEEGRLGGGVSKQSSETPVQVVGLETGVRAIAVGRLHTCALFDGGVWCWGVNANGQLGSDAGTMGMDTIYSPTPAPVFGLSGSVQAIAAGDEHTCAVVGGGAQCWGANGSGQLGNLSAGPKSFQAVPVTGLSGAVQAITAGVNHTCALVSGGRVQCWGSNGRGQLGNGSSELAAGVQAIAAGDSHTCAVLDGGSVRCWGANDAGQLGNDTTVSGATPVQVSDLTAGPWMAAGDRHTCAFLDGGGRIQCWGDNDAGQFGDDTKASSLTPVEVYLR